MNALSPPCQIELSLPSQLGYEVIARDVIGTFAQAMGFDPERVEDVKTALSEACINAIEHGNLLNPTLHTRVVCVYESVEQKLRIRVYDEGVQLFEPGSTPLRIEEKVAGLGPLRGMGLLLVSQLADEAHFVTTEQGNCFQMVWYRQPSP